MLFYITGGAPQAVPGTACVEANQTACIEVCCNSVYSRRAIGNLCCTYDIYAYACRKTYAQMIMYRNEMAQYIIS
jgi:hypothetical protein